MLMWLFLELHCNIWNSGSRNFYFSLLKRHLFQHLLWPGTAFRYLCHINCSQTQKQLLGFGLGGRIQEREITMVYLIAWNLADPRGLLFQLHFINEVCPWLTRQSMNDYHTVINDLLIIYYKKWFSGRSEGDLSLRCSPCLQ